MVDGVDAAGDERGEDAAQIVAARDPLIVVAASMGVGPVEPAAREGLFSPAEELLVAYVHAQCDRRLPAVAAERSLADEHPE
jgi:hypothetical protein